MTDYSTNLTVSGGTVSVGGNVVGGHQNVGGSQAAGDAHDELRAVLAALESAARASADLPAYERDELAGDVARARAAAEQPHPNLQRIAALLSLSKTTLEGMVGTAGSAVALVGMVTRALGLLPPSGG